MRLEYHTCKNANGHRPEINIEVTSLREAFEKTPIYHRGYVDWDKKKCYIVEKLYGPQRVTEYTNYQKTGKTKTFYF